MVRAEIKLFRAPEKSKHRIELESLVIIGDDQKQLLERSVDSAIAASPLLAPIGELAKKFVAAKDSQQTIYAKRLESAQSRNIHVNRSLVQILNSCVSSCADLAALVTECLGRFIPEEGQETVHHAHNITAFVELEVAATGLLASDGQLEEILVVLARLLARQLVAMEQCGAIYVNEVFTDCDYTLRALIALYTKYPVHLAATLSKPTLARAHLINALDRLLTSAQYPKHIVALAGFLLTETVTLATTPATIPALQTALLDHFINKQATPTPILIDTVYAEYPTLAPANYTSFPVHFATNYPHLSRVAILRGLCLSSRIDVLTAVREGSGSPCILLANVYPALIEGCDTAVDAFGRVASLEYLHLWFETLLLQLAGNARIEDVVHVSYSRFFEAHFDRALDIIWRNWESTISSIPIQLNDIFDCLLSIHYQCVSASPTTGAASTFIRDITCRLLDQDWTQKGKYSLLKSLVDREGAQAMFNLRPQLLNAVLSAMGDHTICNSAKGFVELLMENLKKELGADKTLDAKALLTKCEGYWLMPLLRVLTTSNETLCARVIMYAMPAFLRVFPQSLHTILAVLTSNQQSQDMVFDDNVSLRISLSVLNTARGLAIIEGADILAPNHATIERALFHEDDALRMLGLELVALSPKNTERPSRIEIDLLKRFLVLNLKASSPYIRNHTNSILDKFWLRMRESYAKVYRTSQPKGGYTPTVVKDESYLSTDEVVDFINWCASLFVASLYPGAPYPRKMLPLDMLNSFVDVWSLALNKQRTAIVPLLVYIESRSTLFSAGSARTLLHNLWDQYDRVRDVAAGILSKFPAPLPTFSEESDVSALLLWGLRLACSPKARECDTGANVLRLFLDKYVVEGLCLLPTFGASGAIQLVKWTGTMTKDSAILHYITQIVRVLKSQISVATTSLLDSAKFAPMHGLTLSVRQLLSRVDFEHLEQGAARDQWRNLIKQLVDLMFEMAAICLRVVADSAPEGNTPADSLPRSLPSGVLYDDDERLASSFATLSTASSADDVLAQVGACEQEEDGEANDDEDTSILNTATSAEQLKGSAGQIITVCSWLSMKQLSLMLGTIIDRVGFPANEAADSSALLQVDQIKSIGKTFLHILLNTRHKGAIEKTYLGFQVLCSRLMGASHPALYALPSTWIQSLFTRVREQSLNVTRRSAGLPYTFTGLLAGEATHQKKVAGPLLHQVIQTLLTMAKGPAAEDANNLEERSYQPQVHSINILRSIFRNKTMTNEIDAYYADAMMTIVRAYSSTSWSVRNAATMAFSTMVDKVVGVKKVRDEASVLNTATFHHFFAHMPSLHPFLLAHFRRSLDDAVAGDEVALQSSIYAMLVLFARLQPSTMAHPNDALSPAPFVPYIQRCATFSNFMVRSIASRALVPFIASSDVVAFIVRLLADMPVPVAGQPALDFNATHGVLLQVHALIRGHAASLSPAGRADMVREVSSAMTRAMWAVDRHIAPLAYLVFLIYTELDKHAIQLDMLLPNASQSTADLVATLPKILALARQVLVRGGGSLPMASAYIEAAASYVLWNVETTLISHQESRGTGGLVRQDAAQSLIDMIRHDNYEVRVLAMRFLADNREALLPHLDGEVLQSTLINMLRTDTNVTCRKKAARMLPRLGRPVPLDQTFVTFICGEVTSVRSSIKKESIVLLGHIVRESIGQSDQSTLLLDTWIQVLAKSTKSAEQLELRTAVARALNAASQVLTQSTTVSLEMWFAVAKLLEDDDEDVRLICSGVTSRAISNNTTVYNLDPAKALESLHQHLGKLFTVDPKPLVSKYLTELGVGTSVDVDGSMLAGEFSGSRVLFDKEVDNYFEERLIGLQLTARALTTLQVEFSESDIEDTFTRLQSYVDWVRRTYDSTKQSVWNEWLTYHAEIFIPLYKCLVALGRVLL
eukprot:gene17967-21440_t